MSLHRRTLYACLLAACSTEADPLASSARGLDAALAPGPGSGSGEALDASAPARSSEADAGRACVAPAWRMPTLDTQAMRLSELGLYVDLARKELACDLLTWTPRFPLWSDGASKQRWIRLPEGGLIDSSDPDRLRFPVGSLLFKEFALDGKRLETRLVARISESETFFGAFVWREDESDADLVRAGADNVRGTAHDVPKDERCLLCHKGEPGRVLGLSAVQSPGFAPDRLSHPLPELAVDAPGVGYLHGNCAHCHNEYGDGWRQVEMTLRLSIYDGAASLVTQTVEVPARKAFLGHATRVVPGLPNDSALIVRMQVRGGDDAMPPVASELVDPEGLAEVRAWIAGLSAGSGR